MKGQNIKKYQQKELNLICKTDKKTRNYIFFLCRATTFAVILLAVALPIVLKIEFHFEIILYITIFVFLSSGSCFKSVICIQNSLESAPIVTRKV